MADEATDQGSATLLSDADVKQGDGAAAQGSAGDAGAAAKVAADAKAAADVKTAADAKAAQEAADAALTPEARAAKEKAATDKAEADKKAAAQKAPEKYEPFKVPEGMKLDETLIADLETLGKKNNWTQEQAQAIADLGSKQAQALQGNFRSALTKAVAQWAEQSKADKEIGGDKFDENLAFAKKGMAQFGSQELGKVLKESGLGNHPEILRAFYRVGKAMADDKFVQGRDSGGGQLSIEDRLYGAKS
jgi:hypothetical protein